jgi:tRNA_anti-like
MPEVLITKTKNMSFLKSRSAKIILFAVIAAVIGVGVYGYEEYNRTVKDIATITPAFTTSGIAIVEEFTKNDSIANAKYLGKTIAIDGTLKSVDKDENGFYTVVIGDTISTTSVRCSMDSAHNMEASSLKEGTKINVKGICTGFSKDDTGLIGSDIMLNHSCINK